MAKGQIPENAYSVEDRHAALELAATVGISPAARQLEISRRTIYRWIEMYPQLWSDLRAGDPEAHKRGFAVRLEDLAARYAEAEHLALDRAEEVLAGASAKEIAAIIKAMGSSRQAATLGARTVMGEDRADVDVTINFPQIEQAMERLLGAAGPAPALPVSNEADVVDAKLG